MRKGGEGGVLCFLKVLLIELFVPGEDGYVGTAPVTAFPANKFGLKNMVGNVWGRLPGTFFGIIRFAFPSLPFEWLFYFFSLLSNYLPNWPKFQVSKRERERERESVCVCFKFQKVSY